MGTLLNKSRRVNTIYWQIHEAFTSKTPISFFPPILFLSAQQGRGSAQGVPNWASLGGRCYVLGREVTSFRSRKRTSKSKSQWDCAGSETSRAFEQANVQKRTSVSDGKHQAASSIRSTQRATDIPTCMAFEAKSELCLEGQRQLFCSMTHKIVESPSATLFCSPCHWAHPLPRLIDNFTLNAGQALKASVPHRKRRAM